MVAELCKLLDYLPHDKVGEWEKLTRVIARDLELYEIFAKMYMVDIDGRFVFTFDHLSQEEKETLHMTWSNCA